MTSDAAPTLAVDGFEGPLDWLLDQARTRRIDLARLSIAALVDAFAAAFDHALAAEGAAPLARWGDWLVMAATLALLRSRLLLPPDAAEARAAADEAEALRRRLLDGAHARAAADWLDRRPQLGGDVFAAGQPDAAGAARPGDIAELLRACLVALRVPDDPAAYRTRPPPPWSVADASARLAQLLPLLPDGTPLAGFLPDAARHEPPPRRRAAVASTLAASLELARAGALTLRQDAAWALIRVHRAPSDRAAGPPSSSVNGFRAF